MFYRRRKFFLVWGLLAGVALYVPFRNFIRAKGYDDVHSFFDDLLLFSELSALLIIPLCLLYWYISRKRRSARERYRTALGAPAHCRTCKKVLDEQTGKICKVCSWIRCPSCSTCGCGLEKLEA